MINTVPILLLIFNRPDHQRQVLEQIRKAQPKQLFIAADGPRLGNERDEIKCAEARKIVHNVDWDCEVNTLFRDENMGCGPAVSSAITWFFENVEKGIILEDDCVPDLSFFRFCYELLEYYKHNKKIMHISGSNFFPNTVNYSYYFSSYALIWGWATWARAWNHFDFNIVKNAPAWGLQWLRSIQMYKGFCINPASNLVENVGFGIESTHTRKLNKYQDLQSMEMVFPLNHPKKTIILKENDRFLEKNIYNLSTFLRFRHSLWMSSPIFFKQIFKNII